MVEGRGVAGVAAAHHKYAAIARIANLQRDSAIVRALRDAGAVILGKTVTTEMGGAFPGPTTNPFDPGRTPGGSSSGSAAVIGACMVPAAIGTQVGGSLIRPASYCGNCALKPTMGALHRGERQGYSQSHVGVHAGSLADMWRVAMEIARRAGGDPGQPGLFGAPELSPALQPARLIVMETAGWAGLDAETREGFDRILAVLGDAGVEVLRSTDDPLIEAFERGIVEAKAITTDSPGPAPRGLGSTGDSVFNSPTSILGAPAVTVPMLVIEGMPVGIQIVGQRHADARTAGIALAP